MADNTQTFDIVKLIEKNPITRLQHTYQNKFIEKIKESFTENQQHTKPNSKSSAWLLEKHFVNDIDYKVSSQEGFTATAVKPIQTTNSGGRPNETILITVNTFKKLCLKANTKKANDRVANASSLRSPNKVRLSH